MNAKKFETIIKISTAVLLCAGLAVILLSPKSRQKRRWPQREQVLFWHMWTAEWKDVVDRVVEQFNTSQDKYEVVALSVPAPGSRPESGASMKFLLAVAGGDPPDLMAQWNNVIPSWATKGVITPLDELMTAQEHADFNAKVFPAIRKIGSFKDRLYGVCIGLNLMAIYYRADHFRQAGLDPDEPPVSIEQLDEMSRKLYVYSDNGDILRVGFQPTDYHLWLPSFGGCLYDETHQKLSINSDKNLRTLQWMQAYSKEYGFEKIQRFLASFSQGQTGGVDWPFMTGAYSMVVDGQWRVVQLAKFAPSIDYRTAPLPRLDGTPGDAPGYASGNFMIVPRGARCPQGAWEFIKFWSGLNNPKQAAEFYTWGGWLPITQEIVQAPVFQEYLNKYPQFRTFVVMLPSKAIQVAPPIIFQNYMMDRIYALQERVIRMTDSPQDALEQFALDIQREANELESNDHE